MTLERSQRLRYFKSINIADLQVTWFANRTAWMNIKLFTDWLLTLNNRMKRNNRQSFSLLDDAPYPLKLVRHIIFPWSITDVTIQNGFRTAAFINSTSTSSSTIDINVADQSNLCSNDSLKQLESLLAYIEIDDHQLTATEYVDIDSSIPTYNERDDDAHVKEVIELAQEDVSK
ncbi:unnamed protein product [Adineta steineri]|uniref:DDE-1 domain-containing protein n=2 Tax=Adineta steineri TaxID=433720 RepID=A0A815MMR2_9BILA|nr:unnamed protein product [Adineta steineri]